MIQVNAFWLGVLITLVGFVVVIIVMALVASHRKPEEEAFDGSTVMSEEDFQQMIRDVVREAADEVLRERMFGGEEDEEK